jgi:hypothetical protein
MGDEEASIEKLIALHIELVETGLLV